MAEQNDRPAVLLPAELNVRDKEGQMDLADVSDAFVIIEKSENIFIKLNKNNYIDCKTKRKYLISLHSQ